MTMSILFDNSVHNLVMNHYFNADLLLLLNTTIICTIWLVSLFDNCQNSIITYNIIQMHVFNHFCIIFLDLNVRTKCNDPGDGRAGGSTPNDL